jgi:hypothetical protein
MLHKVTFRVGTRWGAKSVEPVVDDIPLPYLVAAYEQENAFERVGSYGGILPGSFRYGPLDAYLLGQVTLDYFAELGGIYLLGCSCGEVGCWPFVASVGVTPDAVIWNQFRQPHRLQRDYSRFGPFVFDRAQYSAAIDTLIAELGPITD